MAVVPDAQSWTTTNHVSHQRYDAWVHLLNETFGTWGTQSNSNRDFNAEIKATDIGSLKVVECVCDPCGGQRTASTVRIDDEERLAIQLVVSGREHMRLGDQEAVLEAGDIFVWDTTQPMTFEVQQRLHKISAVLPLQRFKEWMPDTWLSVPRHVKAGSPTSSLVGSFLSNLAFSNMADRPVNDTALIEAAIALFATRGNLTPADVTLRSSQLRLVKSSVMRRLSDPSLSVEKIAKQNAMSVRNLHWLFEENDETAWRFVVSERLKRCQRDLSNPTMRSRSITDIAFTWGFSDAAYFSRVFKEKFGASPSQFRNAKLRL